MAIEKKEDTSIRLRKRKYEERHKEERKKATKHFDTLIKAEDMDEINAEAQGVWPLRFCI